MRRFLRDCLILVLALFLAAGNACAMAKPQPTGHSAHHAVDADSAPHQAGSGHSVHHGNPAAANQQRHHQGNDRSPQQSGCDHGATSCCAACVTFAAPDAAQAIALQPSPMLFPHGAKPLSSYVVLIDPGIPKQAA